MEKTPSHPSESFWFAASAIVAQPTEGAARKFSGTAYSGKPLAHPYWDQIVIDLSTTRAKEKVPALIEHDRRQRAGFAALSIGNSIEITDGTFLNNEHGRAVAMESDAGFPWEMSVHAEPGSIEQVKPGTTAIVNGYEVNGPAVVFRNTNIREVSFAVTGVDSVTRAMALSRGALQNTPTTTQEEPDMEDVELKAKLSAAEANSEAEKARADKAEAELAALKKEARLSAVKDMFSALGREYSEDAAKPYMDMSQEMFSAIAADMKAMKPQAAEHLFSAHATSGGAPEGGQGEKRVDYLSADFQKSLWRKN